MQGTEEWDTKGLPTVASYVCEKASSAGQEASDKNGSQLSRDLWSRSEGVRKSRTGRLDTVTDSAAFRHTEKEHTAKICTSELLLCELLRRKVVWIKGNTDIMRLLTA